MVAIVIGLVGYIPYLASVFTGQHTPQRATWIIWATLESMMALSAIMSGASLEASALALAYAGMSLKVLVISFKKGSWGSISQNTLVLLGCGIGMASWLFSQDAMVGALSFALALMVSCVPVIKDAKKESLFTWVCWFAAGIISLNGTNSMQDITVPAAYTAMSGLVLSAIVIANLRVRRQA